MKSFLGNFYRHLAIFFWSHCHCTLKLYLKQSSYWLFANQLSFIENHKLKSSPKPDPYWPGLQLGFRSRSGPENRCLWSGQTFRYSRWRKMCRRATGFIGAPVVKIDRWSCTFVMCYRWRYYTHFSQVPLIIRLSLIGTFQFKPCFATGYCLLWSKTFVLLAEVKWGPWALLTPIKAARVGVGN